MKKITDWFKNDPIGSIILQVIVAVLNMLGLGPVLPSAGRLADKSGKAKNKYVGYAVFAVVVLYVLAAKLGLIDDSILQATADVLTDSKVIAPDSIPAAPMDSIPVDTMP